MCTQVPDIRLSNPATQLSLVLPRFGEPWHIHKRTKYLKKLQDCDYNHLKFCLNKDKDRERTGMKKASVHVHMRVRWGQNPGSGTCRASSTTQLQPGPRKTSLVCCDRKLLLVMSYFHDKNFKFYFNSCKMKMWKDIQENNAVGSLLFHPSKQIIKIK